jgi:hypothetical protein
MTQADGAVAEFRIAVWDGEHDAMGCCTEPADEGPLARWGHSLSFGS